MFRFFDVRFQRLDDPGDLLAVGWTAHVGWAGRLAADWVGRGRWAGLLVGVFGIPGYSGFCFRLETCARHQLYHSWSQT